MVSLRPCYMTLDNRYEKSIENKEKQTETRKERELKWYENSDELDVSDFDTYQWYLKFGSTEIYQDPDIEDVELPLKYEDPFQEEFKDLTVLNYHKSKLMIYIPEEVEEYEWHSKFCDTVVF